MKLRFSLFCFVLNIVAFSGSLYSQVFKVKPGRITLNFNKTRRYDKPIVCWQDTVLILKNKKDTVVFTNRVNFGFSQIRGNLDFNYCGFLDGAAFNSCNFQNAVSFIDAQFNYGAMFTSHFQDTAIFTGARFLGIGGFSGGQFQKLTYFIGAKFKGIAWFNEVKFKNEVSFNGSKFENGVNFANTTFQHEVDFGQAEFKQIADFYKITTSDSTVFYWSNSKLPDLINFSENRHFYTEVDLTSADFTGQGLYNGDTRRWHYINLYHSDITKIKIDYQHFRLCFYANSFFHSKNYPAVGLEKIGRDTLKHDNTIFSLKDTSIYEKLVKIEEVQEYVNRIFPSCKMTDTVVKEFLKRSINEDSFPHVLPDEEFIAIYEKVLKNFDANGQKESYEALDIEYRNFKNGWFILPYIWNCYGYHKEWIFLWTAGFLILFTIITFIFLHKLNTKIEHNGVYYIANIPHLIRIQSFKALCRKLWFSFMYTATIFFLFSLKIENMNFKKTGIIYVIIVYSTGLLCLGYVANFVLQK